MPAKTRIVYNKLPEIANKIPELVSRELRRAAFATEAGAKVRAPVDTGNLRASIFTEGAEPGSLRMIVAVGAEYGAFVEFGTRYMAPRAFMGRTTDQTFPALLDALKDLERYL